MKSNLRLFPLNLVLASSAVMAVLFPLNSFAADFTWGGATDSTWTTNTNWSTGTAPVYGTSYLADTLRVSNGAGAGAVYNPGSALTTTFGAGRAFILGSGTNASLTVSSGTIAAVRTTNTGSEALMSNNASGSLLINGTGAVDFTSHLNTFQFFNAGTALQTSNLTISGSGSFSSNGFNLNTGSSGVGTVNLDGGSMAVTAFTRTNTGGSTILNLNGGTLRIRGASNANFLNALTGLQTIVKNGGAVIDSNSFNLTIAEVLEHDSGLGAGLDGGLTKNGAGILTLSGANTYDGTTAINAGTLSAATIVVSGGSSNLGNATSAVTLGSAGAEGTLSYTGANATYTRGFTIGGAGGGRLDVTTAATTLTVNTGAIIGTGLFTVGGSGGKIINAAITHTGGLTKTASSGSIFLNNSSNSYTGATDITGALIVTANNALGSTAGGTTVNASSALGLSGGIDYAALETVSGSGVGTGALTGVTASASRGFIQSTLGDNTFRGNITVNAGGVSRIGTQNGASLTLTGAITQASGSMYFRPGDNGGEYVTLSNSGNSFGGNSVVYTNATSASYSGVRLGVNNALPVTLTITGESGTGTGTALNLNGFNQKLNGLAGSNNLNIINSNTSTASTLTVDNLVDRTTAGTIIRGGVGLGTINVIKDGTFTQTLSGTHDYTGTTVVQDGKLVINGNISTSSLTTVNSGATLGGNATTGALTIAAGGFVAPGNSPGTLTVNGAYTQAGTFAAEIGGLTAGTQHDQINVTGTVNITGGSLNTLFTGSYSLGDMIFLLLNDGGDAITGTYTGLAQGDLITGGGFDWQISYVANSGGSPSFTGGNDIALMAVPEPNVAALLSGIGILALLRRRQ
jgi:autotransporter-associated beta strand protein